LNPENQDSNSNFEFGANLEGLWILQISVFFSFQLDFHRCFSQADLKIRFLIELAVARRMSELAPDT
jgi:hypothetical protein